MVQFFVHEFVIEWISGNYRWCPRLKTGFKFVPFPCIGNGISSILQLSERTVAISTYWMLYQLNDTLTLTTCHKKVISWNSSLTRFNFRSEKYTRWIISQSRTWFVFWWVGTISWKILLFVQIKAKIKWKWSVFSQEGIHHEQGPCYSKICEVLLEFISALACVTRPSMVRLPTASVVVAEAWQFQQTMILTLSSKWPLWKPWEFFIICSK